MAQKKEDAEPSKPGVKIQDLAPSKDAKGGAARNQDGGVNPNAVRNENALPNQDGAMNPNASPSLD